MVKIISWNIRGILTNEKKKCDYLNNHLINNNIDVCLLQEWSIIKKTVNINDGFNPYNNEPQDILFPIQFFPLYYVHYHSTECCILYKKDLNIIPIINNRYLSHQSINRSSLFHWCSILIKNKNNTKSYVLSSIYRSPSFNHLSGNTNKDILNINNDINHPFLFVGDINMENMLWGAPINSKLSNDFIDYCNDINFIKLPDPTHNNKTSRNTYISPIFHSLNFKYNIKNLKIIKTEYSYSDHNIISFEINAEIFHKYNYKKWKLPNESNKYDKYRKLLSSKLLQFEIDKYNI